MQALTNQLPSNVCFRTPISKYLYVNVLSNQTLVPVYEAEKILRIVL